MKTHLPGDYSLTQGLKGDATYLIVKADGTLTDFGLNAVCTHLGCVVPWNKAENKFKCPCHGSQYNAEGKVIRGPAPLSLALAHVVVDGNDTVTFTPWTEQVRLYRCLFLTGDSNTLLYRILELVLLRGGSSRANRCYYMDFMSDEHLLCAVLKREM